MKHSKKYIAFILILCFLFVTKFQILNRNVSVLGKFRGASLDPSLWDPLVAEDVNGGILRVTIDNKEYTNENVDFYMNEKRNIMLPVSMLRDALNCSVSLYDKKNLLVEKHSLSAQMKVGETSAKSGEETIEIESPLIKKKNDYYVSLNDLSKLLGYSCNFDIVQKTMTAADESDSVSLVPSSYDLRERLRVSKIRNQGIYGTCWAFSAISALESSLLPEEQRFFSVDNMTMNNSFHVNHYDGGEYTMGMAYLAAWQGPVYEADDPYGDGIIEHDLEPVAHVQEMRVIDGKNYEGIKEAVFKYGGVQTSLYSTIRSSQGYSQYYNRETNSYCYIGTQKPNHGVVIIGWDDNYPKENFPVPIEEDGAFICQNSWGEEFGEDGIFYVSYYDTNIGTHNVVYTRIEDVNNYDRIYQSDLCGWVGKLGYEKEEIFGANIYKAKKKEDICASGFYATAPNTSYEVYIVKNFEDETSFSRRQKVASGVLEQAGYYTIDFNKPVEVEEGEKYAVVLYLKTPGASLPMAVEYDSGSVFMQDVNLEDGEGYISHNGKTFVNVKEKMDCNLCIKAFARDKK